MGPVGVPRPLSGARGSTGTVEVEATSVVARVSVNVIRRFFFWAAPAEASNPVTAFRNSPFCSALYARLLKYVFFSTHCSLSRGSRLVSTPGEKMSISSSWRFAYVFSWRMKYGWMFMSGCAVNTKLNVLVKDQPNFSIKYATTTAQHRDIPSLECTSTHSPFSSPFSINW